MITRRAALAGAAAAAAASIGLQSASAEPDARKLTLVLDWFINPNHAPLLVADKIGAFAKRGLAIEVIEPADPNDPPKLVAAGQADLAITYQPQFQIQVDQQLPLTRIGSLIDSPLNMLLALGDGPVKTLADLKGRKVGYSVGGFEDALLSTMLGTAGLSVSDVELVNVNFALSQSLLAGSVDAVIGAYRNYELNILALQGKAAKTFFVEDFGVPAYDELIFVANRGTADPMKSVAFLEAVAEAVAYTIAHPDDAWKHFIDGRPQLDDELNRRAFKDTLPVFSRLPAGGNSARYVAFAEFLKGKGLIKEVRPAGDYLVQAR